jgi:hypothetical protein
MLVAFATYKMDLTRYYELAIRIVILILFFLQQTIASLVPTVSLLYEQKELLRLFAWVGLAMRSGLFLFIVIWGVFILLGQSLVVILLGESFRPVYPLVSTYYCLCRFGG